MPRTEVDFSAMDTPPDIGTPNLAQLEQIYEEEITQAFTTMRSIVEFADTKRRGGYAENLVTQFSTTTEHEKGFVKHAAMFRLFDYLGMLDRYFDSEILDREHGWNLNLQIPNRTGRFEIRYRESEVEVDGREKVKGEQKVIYFA